MLTFYSAFNLAAFNRADLNLVAFTFAAFNLTTFSLATFTLAAFSLTAFSLAAKYRHFSQCVLCSAQPSVNFPFLLTLQEQQSKQSGVSSSEDEDASDVGARRKRLRERQFANKPNTRQGTRFEELMEREGTLQVDTSPGSSSEEWSPPPTAKRPSRKKGKASKKKADSSDAKSEQPAAQGMPSLFFKLFVFSRLCYTKRQLLMRRCIYTESNSNFGTERCVPQ